MEKGGKRKVLIIDDDARNIFALRAVLKAKNFECVTASSGVEGLHQLSEDDGIGIVLLDMMMPEMDGYQLLPLIRSQTTTHIPVVAVTAQAMAGDREKCLEAGADAYISKPIDLDHLLITLNEMM